MDHTALGQLHPIDAFKLALDQSGYSVKELASELDWSYDSVRRIFSTDEYWPNVTRIPALCHALKNTIIINWLQQKTLSIKMENQSGGVDCQQLVQHVAQLFGEASDVGQEASAAVADGKLEAHELRRIITELKELVNQCMEMMADLRVAERELAAKGEES